MNIVQKIDKLSKGDIEINLNGYWDNVDEIQQIILNKLDKRLSFLTERLNDIVDDMTTEDVGLLLAQVKVEDLYTDYVNLSSTMKSYLRVYDKLHGNIFSGAYSKVFVDSAPLTLAGFPTQRLSQKGGIPVYWGEDMSTIQLGAEDTATNAFEAYCKPTVSELTITNPILLNYTKVGDDLEKRIYEEVNYAEGLLTTTEGLQLMQSKYAEQGYIFGQVGNVGLHVYNLPDKIVLTKYTSDVVYDMGLNTQWFEDVIGNADPIPVLGAGYPTDSLSLSVWRYEAIPLEAWEEEKQLTKKEWYSEGRIEIPYVGKLRVENYHRQNVQDIPDYVVAVWHKI